MTNVEYKLLNKLDEIPDYKYTGYIWKSDQSSPDLYENKSVDFSEFIDKQNPFIIEGYLYSKKDNLSISIKQIDGKYYISKIDLKGLDLKSDNFLKHKYLSDAAILKANSDQAISKQKSEFKYIKFLQFWEEKKDKLCENMKILKPAWVAFVGFENEGGKDEPQK